MRALSASEKAAGIFFSGAAKGLSSGAGAAMSRACFST